MSTNDQPESGIPSETDHVFPDLKNCSAEEMGRLLEVFRPYLLLIANSKFPRALASKVGPSDLVQLTLARGYRDCHNFRGTTREELAGWLRTILLNYLKMEDRTHSQQIRDISRERSLEVDLVDRRQLTASSEAISREQRQHLAAAMNQLPELYRRAIELRHNENLSFHEVGQQLNRSEEAARKLWARAVRQLQQELANDAG